MVCRLLCRQHPTTRRTRGVAMPRNEPFEVLSGRVASLSIAAILTALLSGCMVGPNYHTPSAPVPPAFKEVNPEPQPTGPTAIEYRDWWKVFHDPALDDLENQADAAN